MLLIQTKKRKIEGENIQRKKEKKICYPLQPKGDTLIGNDLVNMKQIILRLGK